MLTPDGYGTPGGVLMTDDPATTLAHVSEQCDDWATADEHGERTGLSGAVCLRYLERLGAEERDRDRPDRRGRPVTEYRVTQQVTPGRAAELVLGGYWREVREGTRPGGYVPATREAWIGDVRGAAWLRSIDTQAAGLALRWTDGGAAYLSALPEWECTAVELLDYLAAGDWRVAADVVLA